MIVVVRSRVGSTLLDAVELGRLAISAATSSLAATFKHVPTQ
jgi:hypothetical protein